MYKINDDYYFVCKIFEWSSLYNEFCEIIKLRSCFCVIFVNESRQGDSVNVVILSFCSDNCIGKAFKDL